MRTTLDLPENLIQEAMDLTHIKTKTALIKEALRFLIQREKISGIKNYYGRIDPEIDLDSMRDR